MNAPLHRWIADALVAARDRRRAERRPVLIQAHHRDGEDAPVPVTVTDLTADGCRIEGSFDLAEESEVWLSIPGIAPRRARIAWVRQQQAGCEFVFPVLEDMVEEVARTFPPR